MEYKLFVLFVCGFIQSIGGQQFLPIGCPVNWFLHNTNCYKFANDEHRVYETANAYCWSFGARLVTVGTYAEHKFISDWLMGNDMLRQSMWYTSGDYTVGRLFWEAEDRFQDDPLFWIHKPKPGTQSQTAIRTKVVYAYAGGGFGADSYGWTNVTTSTPAYAICEIPRTDSFNIDVLDRGFDYGLGTTEPKEIEKGPVVEIQPESIVIIDGAANIELDCFATGNPNPTYTWFYGLTHVGSTEITSSARYTLSSGVIAIADPEERDVGSYHCRARNNVGMVLSDSANVIMGFLGYFQNIDPEPVYATSFKGTKMDCGVPSYSPGVTYQWFKNFATNIFVWPSNGNMFVSYSGALYVSEVQPTDANKRYYCVASLVATEGYKLAKAYAPGRTNKGLLLLLGSESSSDNDYGPILNTHAFPTPALKGRTIRLECIAYGTHPLFYSWRREDGRPFVKGTVLSAKNRVLTIPDAPLEAEGNYICTCRRGTGAQASKVINVFIETKPYFPYPIKNMLVDPGMSIKWNCKAVARPQATYTWYKNGRPLTNVPGHIRIVGSDLMIQNIDQDRDEGMYQCAATNAHGTTFSTGQLKILSFVPNFKRFPLPEVTLAPNGGNITVPCDVEAAPVPQVSWLKNGGNLNLMPGDTMSRVGMTTKYGLVITGVQFSDAGVYTCEATNDLGTARNVTRLVVIEGIRLVRPPVRQDVLVNRTAFFYCEATYNSNYDMTYVWRFNNRIIDFHLQTEFVSGRSQGIEGLYVMNAQYKNEGIYECEAKTTLHTQRASALLTVQGPPGPPAGLYADDEAVVLARSVHLVWTVTAYIHHAGPINAYDVEAESNYHPGVWNTIATDVPEYFVVDQARNNGKREDQRAFTVEDLVPNASYRFRVRAINVYGRGQEASKPTTSVKIAATEPVLAPREVGGGGGSVGTLTMTWQPFDISEQCGPGIGYNVYWKRMGDERDWKKSKANDTLGIVHGKHVVTVGEDNYYMEYQVKVAAYNNLGAGPNSSVVYIYSAMGMPVSVPKILDADTINSTAVLILWEPVPDNRENMKGRVEGYRVHYYMDKSGDNNALEEEPDPSKVNIKVKNIYGTKAYTVVIGLYWYCMVHYYQDKSGDNNALEEEPDPSKVNIKVKNIYGTKTESVAIGLSPNVDVYVRVQVFNSAGAGPKGEWRWAETYHRTVSAYPTHIEVHPHDQHSVRVVWRGVSIEAGEESLLGYIIRVWKVQEDIRSATDHKTDKHTTGIVGGLQKHNVYVLRVLGFSRAGDGAISEALYFSVLGGSIPFDPTTSEICYSNQDYRMCDNGSGRMISAQVFSILVAVLLAFLLRK